MRMRSGRQRQRIAHVPVRLDKFGRHTAFAQLGAQQLDVRIDRAVQRVGRVGPDLVHQLGAREDAARTAQQRRQQQVLIARQREVVATTGDALSAFVQPQRHGRRTCWHGALLRRPAVARAPQDRLDPGADLTRRKRLAHVIVCAQFQPEHTVDLLAARGQENDRQLAGLADRAADVKAVAVGHTDIEDREVGWLLRKYRQRVARQWHMRDLKALAAQRVKQRVGDGWFILKQQNRN